MQCHPAAKCPNTAWSMMKGQVVKKMNSLPLDEPIYPNKVRFVCMGDTHGQHMRVAIPNGDVYIHTGDFTNCGHYDEIKKFSLFLGNLPHKYKIVIAGNHELSFDNQKYGCPSSVAASPGILAAHVYDGRQYLLNCTYLQDSLIQIYGIKIYGSPWTPEYKNWAFNVPRGSPCMNKWNLIPSGVDVLVTHGPPVGHGDILHDGMHAGCVDLLLSIQKRIKPKYHVFGHIHEGYGITTDEQTIFVNCATCDVNYDPVHSPIIFDIPLPKGVIKA